MTLAASGFVILTNSFSTTAGAANSNVTIGSARLDSFLNFASSQPLRAGVGTVAVTVTSSNPAVGTITTSPLLFDQNVDRVSTTFDPAAAGTSTISVGTPAGFMLPGNLQQITVTVN